MESRRHRYYLVTVNAQTLRELRTYGTFTDLHSSERAEYSVYPRLFDLYFARSWALTRITKTLGLGKFCQMDWFSRAADAASIVGLIVTAFALYYARTASQAARDARRGVRRANATEALDRMGNIATLLQACVENDQQHEAVVRARDLGSDVSRYKTRYERFLDSQSKARLDEARAQVGVVSRALATRGVPTTAGEKMRLLRICHDDVVAVLNEESAKIIAAIEKEDE